MGQPSPTDLYRRATTDALAVAEGVRPDQLDLPTPCSAWTVQDLLDHLVGGTHYLASAIAGTEPSAPTGSTPADFLAGVNACLAGLAQPGALDRTCTSPLGFDWTVEDATAGTFMDVLIHTWDTATATAQPAEFDPELVDACVAAGIVGPAVSVADDATPQARLLAAMGRTR